MESKVIVCNECVTIEAAGHRLGPLVPFFFSIHLVYLVNGQTDVEEVFIGHFLSTVVTFDPREGFYVLL